MKAMGDNFKNIKNSKIISRSIIKGINDESVATNSQQMKEKVIHLLQKNKIDEVIDLMISFFKENNNRDAFDSITLLSARKSEIDIKTIHGVLEQKEVLTEMNKIKESILVLITREIR